MIGSLIGSPMILLASMISVNDSLTRFRRFPVILISNGAIGAYDRFIRSISQDFDHKCLLIIYVVDRT